MTADVHAYRFNSDAFAFESFDDEIVVLNVIDGIYYAFGGAAVAAWPFIIAQHAQPAIASALAARYGADAGKLAGDLDEFVGHLRREDILLTAPGSGSEIDCSALSVTTYQGFSFERHDDMEDLLTLDPIHDVDPQKGWPSV